MSDMTALVDRAGLPDEERALQTEWRARYAKEVLGAVIHRAVPSPKVTLAVISYRAKEYLLECLQHLRGQTVAGEVPFEILLADSGGIEHLRDRTASLCDVDLRLRDGLPLNVARNAAAAWARGEYIAYIDDDGLVAPTFVETVLRVFQDPKIAAMRGRIVAKEHPYFNSIATHYDRGDAMVDDVLATEGHMAIRRGAYLAVGGFPDEFYGAEGVYLVYRIHKELPGARVVYVPDLLMRHDYFDGLKNLVVKTRKYDKIRDKVDRLTPDPDFLRYLDEYLRTRMPKRELTAELKVARGMVQCARWVARRLPGWALERAGIPG